MTKADIYGGKNPRELPLYTIPDAARVVRINPATLRTWASVVRTRPVRAKRAGAPSFVPLTPGVGYCRSSIWSRSMS